MKIILIVLSCIFLYSCTTSNQSSSERSGLEATATLDDPDLTIDLTIHLQRLSGLSISGQGANARLSIRGINSFTAGTEPLIILDGGPVSNYETLYHSVLVANIKKIEVLKNPGEIGIYGVRGANGVLKVTTK